MGLSKSVTSAASVPEDSQHATGEPAGPCPESRELDNRRFRLRHPKWTLFALIVLSVSIAVYLLRQHWTLEELVHQELELRRTIDERPVTGFIAGLVVFTLFSFIPGLTGKALIVAWLYGFWRSLLIVNIGLTLAAVGEMLLARYFVRDYIQSRFGFYLLRLNELLQREGASCVFALRMAHVPYTFTNYALGATRLTVPQFWWATQLGMLPGNAIFVYAGAQVPTLHEIVHHGVQDAIRPEMMVAFVLLGIAPLVTKYFVKRLRRREAAP